MQIHTAETITTFDNAVKSLLRVKWSAEKIAKQLCSKESLGNEGVSYPWAMDRIHSLEVQK